MRARLTDPRIFLAAALVAAAAALLVNPGSRPLLQIIAFGLGEGYEPGRLLKGDPPEAENGVSPPGLPTRAARWWTARAVLEGEGPAAMQALDRAVASDPADPDLRLLRLLFTPEGPVMVTSISGTREQVMEDLGLAASDDPENAVPHFYRAVLHLQDGDEEAAEKAMRRAARSRSWVSGLDLLQGAAPAAAAQRYGRRMGPILTAEAAAPMVTVVPAARAITAYLDIHPGRALLSPSRRWERTREVAELALLIRSAPARTMSEEMLSDLLLGYVRTSAAELPPEGTYGGEGVLEQALRAASPRAGTMHVLRDQRNRLARTGMVTLAGLFLGLLWWLGGALLLMAGLAALLGGVVPFGGLPFAAGDPPALRLTRVIWIGGGVLGAAGVLALGYLQSAVPSGPWPEALTWLLQRSLPLAGGGLLASLLLSWTLHRRGLMAQPLIGAFQMAIVAAALLTVVWAGAIFADVDVVGSGLAGWYEPSWRLGLLAELARYPLPM